MSEIPEDIMEAAEDALDNALCHDVEAYGGSYEDSRLAAIKDIARAIIAERERCAKLCETTAMCTPYGGTVPTHGRYVPAEAVDEFHQGSGYAALIRSKP